MRPAVRMGLAVLLVSTACDLPRDPHDTLARISGDTLRVGYVVNPPWVVGGAGAPSGVEPDLVRELAGEVDAVVTWVGGPASEVVPLLESHELDLVVGGFTRDSPWARRVAFTLPYHGWTSDRRSRQRVLALPRGENAWLVRVERFLYEHRRHLAGRIEEVVDASS